MAESVLDYAAMATSTMTDELATFVTDKHDDLIREYVAKMDDDPNVVSVLDPEESAEWVYGPEGETLASFTNGYVTLVDFFTYCCINCQHILPDLHDLEDLYSHRDGFLVVGIHSAKFEAERLPSNVLHAIKRLNIRHPVLNDPNSKVWNRVGVNCWPTLVLLNPAGKPIIVLAGEGHRDLLFRVVTVAIDYYRETNKLQIDAEKKMKFEFDTVSDPMTLKFPGKISLSPFSNRKNDEPWMAVSDSGNNRIIIVDYFDKVLHIIGGTDPKLRDGNFSEARFNNPQGMCWIDKNTLIVCDTSNHVLRRVSLDAQRVDMFAGTGIQAEFGDQGGLKYCQQALASPWDIVLYRTADMDMSLRKLHMPDDVEKEEFDADGQPVLRRVLLVASAGSHQIWAVYLDSIVWWKYKTYAEGTVLAIVGSGREENRNNRYPISASLAQPSGLTINGDSVYIADSESSSIRHLDLRTGQLSALAGADRNPINLFAFGDIDGKGFAAKLQHPLGVSFCVQTTTVFVADTYNHKIKTVDPITGECTTYYPKMETNCSSPLSEPGDVCVSPDFLIVADTNNHRIVALHRDDERTLKVIDLKFPLPVSTTDKPKDYEFKNIIACPKELVVSSAADGRMCLMFDCFVHREGDKELHMTPEAPQRWTVKVFDDAARREDKIHEWETTGGVRTGRDLPAKFEMRRKSPHRRPDAKYYLRIEFFISLCEDGLCFLKSFAVDGEVTVDGDAKHQQNYELLVKLSFDDDNKVTCEKV